MELDVDDNGHDTIAIDDESEVEIQDLLDHEQYTTTVSNSTQIEYNRDITEEVVDFIMKILHGSLDMPSLKEKLLEHHLEIKYVEKKLDEEGVEMSQKVHYVSGQMSQKGLEFILDNSGKYKNVTSLTVISCSDPNNQKTTKVIFHEKPNIPQTANNLPTMNILNKHYQSQKCSICHQRFANYSLLNEHRKSAGHYLRCTKCNKRFKNDNALRRHQKAHAKLVVMKQLQCATCKVRFSNISTLSKHLLMHNRLKSYQCETCGKSFKTFGEMNAHRKFHNHHCDICGREFSRHSNLLRHAEIHKGEGHLYKCGICDCSYKFISTLTRHVVQNHMKQ
ncbi:zinc finger protein [Oryctes borbonicus]|uniref:Zinc finger protein n=1 Tax=Oryctes borbonicus TaxID=1629725 RepID=A0A0T6B884_9SCAR|nr:zinc finger protein [Oryctes borbonicus]